MLYSDIYAKKNEVSQKLDKNLGADKKGKILTVDDSGNIITAERDNIVILETSKTKNILKPGSITFNKNFNSRGEIIDSGNYSISDYIPVCDFNEIKAKTADKDSVFLRYVISYNVKKEIVAINENIISYKITSNDVYVRLSIPLSDSQEPSFMVINNSDSVLEDGDEYSPITMILAYIQKTNVIGLENELAKRDKEIRQLKEKKYIQKIDPICDEYNTTSEFIDLQGIGHETLDAIYGLYDTLVSSYPDYISKSLVGNVNQGMPIYRYDFKPAKPLDIKLKRIPKIYYESGIHGGEYPAILVGYRFFKDLAENWRTNKLLTRLRFGCEFTVVPIVNPYGFLNGTRKNENGVDLNRNFTNGWRSSDDPEHVNYSGQYPASEISTQLIENIMKTEVFDFGIDHHIYGPYSTSGKIAYFVASVERPDDVSFENLMGIYLNEKFVSDFQTITEIDKGYFQVITGKDFAGYAYGSFPNGVLYETMTDLLDEEIGTIEESQKYNVESLGCIFYTAMTNYYDEYGNVVNV